MKTRSMTSVYLTGEGSILCLYRIGSRVVSRRYVGAAGGHFEPEELDDPRACVLREMEEELGLREADVSGLQLRYITLRYMAGEIRQNYYFFGRLETRRPLESNEGTLRWVEPEEFAELPMPVSAKHMMLHYLKEGQYTELLYGGITRENGTDFVPMRQFEG